MSIVVALGHFCEQHGPRVVYTTQSFHSSQPDDMLEEQGTGLEMTPVVEYATPTPLGTPGPPGLMSTPRRTIGSASTVVPTSDHSCCAACGWRVHSPGFISYDHDAAASYVSRHHPTRPEVYSILRQACLRALSSEVCVYRHGPLIFGDQEHGFCFSYNFTVADPDARGGLRQYCFLLLMSDILRLVASWHFLRHHLQILIRDMTSKVRHRPRYLHTTQSFGRVQISPTDGFCPVIRWALWLLVCRPRGWPD
ncbi:uncharacterized protein MONBRDRAFT_15082 [Monosiga brevicollis MX1]|uniref:UDENN FLCN/SMCR8-type domain-containing protein n=1 Tax=Monosiga brevicollis TaxID=81824 RepID=A9USZ4_MONBE|nr:uncharacterized protein MONBRDRAFT_15082 [Monosiga brevicollis MX1]EDQ91154.1 predicted protein [Monosiga brevicollis MX1]|eukprot:XP_001743576.1 hypothetical protein [Monosiga brevicollis MX1]